MGCENGEIIFLETEQIWYFMEHICETICENYNQVKK